jgi:hypothetical protein
MRLPLILAKLPSSLRITESIMRIAIYARVSTKDQSCDLQVRDLKAYCSARKLAYDGRPVTQNISVRDNQGKVCTTNVIGGKILP